MAAADKVDTRAALALCEEMPLFRQRLFDAGLLRAGHAMQEVEDAAGYDTAEALAAQGYGRQVPRARG